MKASPARRVIVDTGPLVAVLHNGDQHHAWCDRVFQCLIPPLVTTEAVVTEAFYLLAPIRPAQQRLSEWLHEDRLRLVPVERPGAVCDYALRYKTDFADATIVHLSERFPAARVFTVDFKDFRVFRRFGDQPIPLIEKTRG